MRHEDLLTNRLRLTKLRRGVDEAELCRIAGDRTIADTTISVPHPFLANNADEWISKYNGTDAHLGWAVRFDDEELCGFVGLNHIDHEHEQAEISFWVDPKQSGKGIVTEAAQAVLDFAFARAGINRIEAYHMARNPGSARVLEKLGFRKEGILRERVVKWGSREDVWLWSRVQSDDLASG